MGRHCQVHQIHPLGHLELGCHSYCSTRKSKIAFLVLHHAAGAKGAMMSYAMAVACPQHLGALCASQALQASAQELPLALCRTYITQPLLAGMIVSNEPGYYEDGAFGIRIENLLHIQEADTQFHFGGQSYFSFERLTLVPLQRKMLRMEVGVRLLWLD